MTTHPRECSIAAALDVIGERWSLLVVRELLLGWQRFSEIQRHTGAPRDILTARLRKLEEQGIVERQRYSDRPPRDEYVLTEPGRALAPILLTLMTWGDRYRADDVFGGPPRIYVHSCGEVFRARVACRACGEAVQEGSLTERVGEGLPLERPLA